LATSSKRSGGYVEHCEPTAGAQPSFKRRSDDPVPHVNSGVVTGDQP
jgi:hypothetical protein